MNTSFEKHDDFSSSSINCLWYSKDQQQLIVQYKGGAQYRYNDVTPQQWESLQSSDSKGKFINESIKSKPYQKMVLTD